MSKSDEQIGEKSDFENAILILSSPNFKGILASYEDEVIFRFSQLLDIARTEPQDRILLKYDFTIALDNLMTLSYRPAENETTIELVKKFLKRISSRY